jgi:nicotinamidase-related amidase
MNAEQLMDDSRPFLEWLVNWYDDRPTLDLARVVEGAGGAEKVAVVAVDVTRGFCYEGPLSSPRVAGIVEPVARLFRRAHELGVHHFVLPQDAHSPDAVEFGSYPPHCVAGTDQAQTVAALRELPFSDEFTVLTKNSISVSINTGLDDWLEDHPAVTTFLAVGDCTDICTYQLAMHLRMRADAFGLRDVRVIVPIDGVDTFHTPVDVAEEQGIMPHHGDLLHLVFLYSMALNGVQVVAEAH